MRKLLLHILLIFLFSTCRKQLIQQPILVNGLSVIVLSNDTIQFKTKDRNWEVCLQSFIQPLPLQIQYNDSGFTVSLKNQFGVIEGPAQIILSNNDQTFFYSITLKNKVSDYIIKKDYRSPKTVNPDSSLQHQRMIHNIDIYRNLLTLNKNYFHEEMISLSPKVGVYMAIKEQSLTSFYVQAGSCVSIKLKSVFDKEKKVFKVTTDLLKDKYNNQVADGTTVAFIYNDKKETYRMEAALLNGIATVYIPYENKNYTVLAKINNTKSNAIQLTQ